jgi:predicted dehydrogenase
VDAPSIVAVLGLGSIGLRHAGNLLELGCQVRGFDPDPMRGVLLVERGGKLAASPDAALEDAAVAVIATPHESHLEHLSAALRHGCHAFVEKPIADTVVGVPEALARAEGSQLQVFVGFNLRFHPAVVRGKRLLAAGALGTPLWSRLIASSYLPDWRPGQDHRKGYAADPVHGGVLFDFIHEFDLANHLLGPGVVRTAAARSSGAIEIPSEDIADVVLGHPGGVLSTLHVDYVTRPRRRVVEIAGTEGYLQLDLDQRRLLHLRSDGSEAEAASYDGSYAGDYLDEMRAVLAAVRGEASDLCNGQQGLVALEQVIAARNMAGLPQ